MRGLNTAEQRARARIVLCSAGDLYRERRGSLLECLQHHATLPARVVTFELNDRTALAFLSPLGGAP